MPSGGYCLTYYYVLTSVDYGQCYSYFIWGFVMVKKILVGNNIGIFFSPTCLIIVCNKFMILSQTVTWFLWEFFFDVAFVRSFNHILYLVHSFHIQPVL